MLQAVDWVVDVYSDYFTELSVKVADLRRVVHQCFELAFLPHESSEACRA